jgi:hypothetical protein
MLTCGKTKSKRTKNDEMTKTLKNLKAEPESMDENSNPVDESTDGKSNANIERFTALLRSLSSSPTVEQEISVTLKDNPTNTQGDNVTTINKRKRGCKVAIRNDDFDEIQWENENQKQVEVQVMVVEECNVNPTQLGKINNKLSQMAFWCYIFGSLLYSMYQARARRTIDDERSR